MSDYINGYRIVQTLSNADAGFAKWGFAKKGGREYFIKEFLNPVYPTDESVYDEKTKERIRLECQDYQRKKGKLYTEINRVSDGNLIRIEEFFRWNSKYYITTRRIRPFDPERDRTLEMPDRRQICLTLSHALMRMHSAGIIHADIKPSNILLEKTIQGGLSGRLIDVDCSFFEGEQPKELVGDQVYFSPEAIVYMMEGPETVRLTCKMDVFSMGLLFHQIMTGALPAFPAEYHYAFEACLDGKPLTLKSLPKVFASTISGMLCADPDERLSMEEVFQRLSGRTAEPSPRPAEPSQRPAEMPESRIIFHIPTQTPAPAVRTDKKTEAPSEHPPENVGSAFRRPGDL